MSELTLARVMQRIQQLPSLSVVVAEVLHSFNNENVDVQTLVGSISRDQGLVARVLRVANSAFYGLPNHVGSIGEAVVVLGFHSVRSLVLAAGIINQFPPGGGKAFDRLEFWRHAIGTGVAARVLDARPGHRELAFTAGLLHDVGRLVLDAYFHDDFEGVLAYRATEDCEMIQAESAVLGLTHATIGCEVAKRWKFPLPLQLAIRDHHCPDAEPHALLTDCVHVANVLCHLLEIGHAGDNLAPPLAPGAWQRLGLNRESLKDRFREIERLNASINLLVND